MNGVIAYPAGGRRHHLRGQSAPEDTKLNRFALPIALAALIGTGAQALEPLGQNKYVVDRLVAARIADRIRKTCSEEIGARMLKALSEASALQSWAVKQGYPKADIKSFIKDKTEKHRIYDVAERYLAANGAKGSDVAGFCALGKKEIAAGSIAGSLIYEK